MCILQYVVECYNYKTHYFSFVKKKNIAIMFHYFSVYEQQFQWVTNR